MTLYDTDEQRHCQTHIIAIPNEVPVHQLVAEPIMKSPPSRPKAVVNLRMPKNSLSRHEDKSVDEEAKHSRGSGRSHYSNVQDDDSADSSSAITVFKDLLPSGLPSAQVWVAGSYLFAGSFFNTICQVLIQRSDFAPSDSTPLPDAGFATISFIDAHEWSDYLLAILIVVSSIRWVFEPSRRSQFFIRYALLQGTMFWLRGVSISITRLPNPLQDCKTDISADDRSAVVDVFRIMMGQTVTCRDVLFSGHAVTTTLLTMFWHRDTTAEQFHFLPGRFRSVSSIIVRFMIWNMLLWTFLVMISTHFHYSVDIFVGSIISALLFFFYHSSVDVMTYMIRCAHFSAQISGQYPEDREKPGFVKGSTDNLSHMRLSELKSSWRLLYWFEYELMRRIEAQKPSKMMDRREEA